MYDNQIAAQELRRLSREFCGILDQDNVDTETYYTLQNQTNNLKKYYRWLTQN